jgi:hypothetical protein
MQGDRRPEIGDAGGQQVRAEEREPGVRTGQNANECEQARDGETTAHPEALPRSLRQLPPDRLCDHRHIMPTLACASDVKLILTADWRPGTSASAPFPCHNGRATYGPDGASVEGQEGSATASRSADAQVGVPAGQRGCHITDLPSWSCRFDPGRPLQEAAGQRLFLKTISACVRKGVPDPRSEVVRLARYSDQLHELLGAAEVVRVSGIDGQRIARGGRGDH